jgi:transposase
MSSLPVWLDVLSGNKNDKKMFKVTVNACCQQLSAGEQPYLVMNSAMFSKETCRKPKICAG